MDRHPRQPRWVGLPLRGREAPRPLGTTPGALRRDSRRPPGCICKHFLPLAPSRCRLPAAGVSLSCRSDASFVNAGFRKELRVVPRGGSSFHRLFSVSLCGLGARTVGALGADGCSLLPDAFNIISLDSVTNYFR